MNILFIYGNRYFLIIALRPSREYFKKSHFLFYQLNNIDNLNL